MADQLTVSRAAEALLARGPELVDRMTTAIAERIPALAVTELRELVTTSCEANLTSGLRALRQERFDFPDELPEAARRLAEGCARLGVPLTDLLRAYRIGHELVLDEWLTELAATPLPTAERTEAQRAGSVFFFRAVDRLTTLVATTYTRERERLLRSREQRRVQLVRDLIGGEEIPAEVLERDLGYDVSLTHVALVLRDREPERLARKLAQGLDAGALLVVAITPDSAWAWIGRMRPPPVARVATAVRAALAREPPYDGRAVGIGGPAGGRPGFRLAHREAVDAFEIAARAGEPLAVFEDVSLEALALRDRELATRFVARELGPLAANDRRSAVLRATLSAWFESGHNQSAAALRLGVHEHTVAYRLRNIERLLGRPPRERRAELEVALRLWPHLADTFVRATQGARRRLGSAH